jgi:hypothetical protein
VNTFIVAQAKSAIGLAKSAVTPAKSSAPVICTRLILAIINDNIGFTKSIRQRRKKNIPSVIIEENAYFWKRFNYDGRNYQATALY